METQDDPLSSSPPHANQENEPLSQETSLLPSSPLAPLSSGISTKLRKPPPITPRRFNRFFNPSFSRQDSEISARRRLKDITSTGSNRGHPSELDEDVPRASKRLKSSSLFAIHTDSDETPQSSPPTLDSSPPPTSPLKPVGTSPLRDVWGSDSIQIKPIERARVLQHLRPQPPLWSVQPQFHFKPTDVHNFPSNVPFCTTACHTNSLIAIGDEGGYIRLVETTAWGSGRIPPFSESYITFQPHSTAIGDLCFSQDDLRLASASGDQTARITDMRTQTTLCIMRAHTSSVKQVAFQPGNDHIVATCGRDGLVAFWDTRCHSRTPQHRLEIPLDSEDRAPRATMYSAIQNGHAPMASSIPATPTTNPTAQSPSTSRNNPSITALLFLPQSPQHFLTATDASSTIRLWDIRSKYSSRRAPSPLSYVSATSFPHTPKSKSQSRGPHSRATTSLALPPNNPSRLYQVCKDSSIYVYSTSHLLLGQPPAPSSIHPASSGIAPTEGLGPLYALRDPTLRVSSFYVRASIREAKDGRDEFLAVGSGGLSISTGSSRASPGRTLRSRASSVWSEQIQRRPRPQMGPVLFPTDERALRRLATRHSSSSQHDEKETLPLQKSQLHQHDHDLRSRTIATSSCKLTHDAGFPIYENVGTMLRGGHTNEVTDVCWTSEGACVSIADDFRARLWWEGRDSGENGDSDAEVEDSSSGSESEG